MLNRYPLSSQKSWDNSGWQISLPVDNDKDILAAVSLSPAVVSEAVEKNVGLIITHHPLFFKTVKSINHKDTRGKMIAELVKEGISVFSLHTPVDSLYPGIADYWSEVLSLEDVCPVAPESENYKCVTYIPEGNFKEVSDALLDALEPEIYAPSVRYTHTGFSFSGTGRFVPRKGFSNPHIGSPGKSETVREICFETVANKKGVSAFLKALDIHHPYEEPAFEIVPVFKINSPSVNGFGRRGRFKKNMTLEEIVSKLQKAGLSFCQTGGLRHKKYERAAVFPGSGADYISSEKAGSVFITSDAGFHDAERAFNAGITLINTSHFEIERPFVKILSQLAEDISADVKMIASEKDMDFLTNHKRRSSC
ncbi:MAG: Nif3-like dinuclear metal center hexameric protein [bacterium]